VDKQLVSIDVLREKYANGDTSITEDHIYQRVAKGISKAENTDPMRKHWESIFYTNMKNGAIGAGRIMSAAGTDMQATLINCFIQPVADSVLDYDEDGNPGIYTALAQAAETMRRGGGVGYNFSKIRPYGAFVKSTHSFASGPCSFINIFDVSCSTVEAAGFRRGAQLAALNIDHPDIEKFIVAKREKGKWNNFNISVLVTDEFMKAKTNDEDWELIHKAKPSKSLIDTGAFQRNDGLWVYKTVKAKYLWDIIMKSNYDFAEPGILFENNINNDNNLRDIEYIDTTNPCVTDDSWIHTSKGPRQVKDLIDKPIEVFVNGKLYKSENGFFSTGNKPVFRLNTIEGYNVKLTENHLVLVNRNNEPSVIRNWIEAKDIRLGDKIVLHNHELNEWDSHGTYDEGYLLGVFIGDGHYSGEDNSAFISAYKKGNPDGLMKAFLDSSKILNLRSDHKGWNEHINSVGETKYIFKSTDLKKLSTVYGLFPNKVIESNIEMASFNFYKGFLKGFFDTDGTVAINNNIITSLRYSQSDLNRLYAVQRMLARLGVMSKLYKERRVESYRLLPDGNGGKKEYLCKAQHELVISKDNITRFLNIIGTNDTSHLNRIKQNTIKNNKFYKEEYMARFLNLTPIGEQEVYDIQVPGINAFDCDGAYLHNCGEEPLPAYGCCNLGPVILPKFVKDPFTDYAKFDYEALRDAVEIHVRFLDNVLDVTLWPLIEQKQQADDKRRIGIGFTGLANALAMLGLKYNSKKGIEEARSIVEIMRNSAYTASSNLAAEKGSFPKFNVEQYLNEGTFASRLPDKIKELIKEQGIRNSHLLSVAPTGTVSLAFADNASNGIEPPFSLAYTRKKRNSDGTHTFYNVLDHGLRIFLNTLEKEFANVLLEAIIGYKESFNYKNLEFNVKECLPKSIVTAMELSVDDHLNMMAAIQPYIDSSISKTVNVPVDYPFDDFKLMYDKAYTSKLKGVAAYRPNDTLGSVLSVGEETPKLKEPIKEENIIPIDNLNSIIERRKEVELEAITKKVSYIGPDGKESFYLIVSFIDVELEYAGNKLKVLRPIEVFIAAHPDGVPREWIDIYARNLALLARSGLNTLCKALNDSRKVKSDKGLIRYGHYTKQDGTKVPRYHDSSVACIAYAVQEILTSKNIINENGNPYTVKELFDNNEDLKTLADSIIDDDIVIDNNINTENTSIIHGKKCNECGADAVIKKDGCLFCTSCGNIGTCG